MCEAAQDFIERVSVHLEAYGLPKIAGRMLGSFLIHGQVRSLDELAECLQVSKGSASTNARLLERLGLLERRSRPGDRRDFYGLADNPWKNMFAVSQDRMRDVRDLFTDISEDLPPNMEEARHRLAEWRDFYTFVLSDMDRRVERWKEHRADREEASASE